MRRRELLCTLAPLRERVGVRGVWRMGRGKMWFRSLIVASLAKTPSPKPFDGAQGRSSPSEGRGKRESGQST